MFVGCLNIYPPISGRFDTSTSEDYIALDSSFTYECLKGSFVDTQSRTSRRTYDIFCGKLEPEEWHLKHDGNVTVVTFRDTWSQCKGEFDFGDFV